MERKRKHHRKYSILRQIDYEKLMSNYVSKKQCQTAIKRAGHKSCVALANDIKKHPQYGKLMDKYAFRVGSKYKKCPTGPCRVVTDHPKYLQQKNQTDTLREQIKLYSSRPAYCKQLSEYRIQDHPDYSILKKQHNEELARELAKVEYSWKTKMFGDIRHHPGYDGLVKTYTEQLRQKDEQIRTLTAATRVPITEHKEYQSLMAKYACVKKGTSTCPPTYIPCAECRVDISSALKPTTGMTTAASSPATAMEKLKHKLAAKQMRRNSRTRTYPHTERGTQKK